MHRLLTLTHQFKPFRENIPALILIAWLLIIVPLFLPNMGGTGLALPQNILGWVMMIAIAGITLVTLPRRHQLLVTPCWRYAAVAVALLAVPLFYTRPEWVEHAQWRHLGLTGGLLFWLALVQWRWTTRQRQWVMYGLLFATALQALLTAGQLFHLPGFTHLSYPLQTGVFQQRNILASFWAVGLGLALGMFLSPAFCWSRYERCRLGGLSLLLFALPAMLTLQQSRTGSLSAGLIVAWGILLFIRRRPARAAVALGLIAVGTLVAMCVVHFGHSVVYQDHLHSNSARLSMYRDTLRMIMLKPWQGWGYGGFEYAFQHFRISQIPPTKITEIARYPHNELLYWLVEGGAVAAAGLALLGFAAWRLMRQLWLQSTPAGEKLPLCLAMLPLLFHSQTEYPFYLSTLHWAIFLVLLVMLESSAASLKREKRLPVAPSRLITALLPVVSLCGVVVLLAALYSQQALTRFEQGGLAHPETAARAMRYDRLVNLQRWDYDLHTVSLLRYNLTRDNQLLLNYTHWAEGYLLARVDANVYANLITIYRFLGRPGLADKHRKVAVQLFPEDMRFHLPEDITTPPEEAIN